MNMENRYFCDVTPRHIYLYQIDVKYGTNSEEISITNE